MRKSNSSKIFMLTLLAVIVVVVLDFFKITTLMERVIFIITTGLLTMLFQSIWNRWTAKPMTAPKITRGWLLDKKLLEKINLAEREFENIFVNIEEIQDDVYRKIIEEEIDEEGAMGIVRRLQESITIEEGDSNEQKK